MIWPTGKPVTWSVLRVNHIISSGIFCTGLLNGWPTLFDQLHKSHNASSKYPTMHHFVKEMCTFLLQNGALWDICRMYCGICATDLIMLWDSWDGSKHLKVSSEGTCLLLHENQLLPGASGYVRTIDASFACSTPNLVITWYELILIYCQLGFGEENFGKFELRYQLRVKITFPAGHFEHVLLCWGDWAFWR